MAQPLAATADLSQNTLSHFLDRFVYKNPKKRAAGIEGKGASAMQPAGSSIEGVKLRKGEVPQTQVNQPGFWKKKESEIPADQMFFHKYFNRKDEMERKQKRSVGKGDEEEEEEEKEKEEEKEEEEDNQDEEQKDADAEENDDGGDDDDDEGSDPEEDEIWKVMKATMPTEGEDEDLLEDSDVDDDDGLPSDFDAAMASEDEEDEVFNEDDSESEDEDGASDVLSLVEDSDNEDLVPLDDLPEGLIAYDGTDSEEEWGGIRANESNKRKRNEEKNKQRKKLRALPKFASYEDYAKMIEEGPEDDL